MESLSIVRPHRLGTLPVRRFLYFVSYGNSEAVAFVPTSENFLTKSRGCFIFPSETLYKMSARHASLSRPLMRYSGLLSGGNRGPPEDAQLLLERVLHGTHADGDTGCVPIYRKAFTGDAVLHGAADDAELGQLRGRFDELRERIQRELSRRTDGALGGLDDDEDEDDEDKGDGRNDAAAFDNAFDDVDEDGGPNEGEEDEVGLGDVSAFAVTRGSWAAPPPTTPAPSQPGPPTVSAGLTASVPPARHVDNVQASPSAARRVPPAPPAAAFRDVEAEAIATLSGRKPQADPDPEARAQALKLAHLAASALSPAADEDLKNAFASVRDSLRGVEWERGHPPQPPPVPPPYGARFVSQPPANAYVPPPTERRERPLPKDSPIDFGANYAFTYASAARRGGSGLVATSPLVPPPTSPLFGATAGRLKSRPMPVAHLSSHELSRNLKGAADLGKSPSPRKPKSVPITLPSTAPVSSPAASKIPNGVSRAASAKVVSAPAHAEASPPRSPSRIPSPPKLAMPLRVPDGLPPSKIPPPSPRSPLPESNSSTGSRPLEPTPSERPPRGGAAPLSKIPTPSPRSPRLERNTSPRVRWPMPMSSVTSFDALAAANAAAAAAASVTLPPSPGGFQPSRIPLLRASSPLVSPVGGRSRSPSLGSDRLDPSASDVSPRAIAHAAANAFSRASIEHAEAHAAVRAIARATLASPRPP